MRPVVFILADAFRFDYIEKHNLKFLKKFISDEKVVRSEKLYPSTGYCEIIEYFTGQESNEHGMFSQITAIDNWQEKTSPKLFKAIEPLDLKLAGIPKVRFVWGKLMARVLPMFLDKSVANVKYKVPLSILNRFTPTESLYEYDSYEFGGDKNVFQQFKNENKTYDLDDFVKHNKITGTDRDRFSRLESKIKDKTLKDFTMFYISAPEYAHFFGVDGDQTKVKLQEFDSEVEQLDKMLSENYDEYDLIIVGDHGMLDVEKSVDIESVIKLVASRNGYKLGDDFLYFIDSTVCRLWYKDDSIKDKFESEIEKEIGGNLELSGEVLDYLAQFKPKYGNSLYMLKANRVYFPDFFNGTPNKGMHGYLNHYPGQQGCIIWRSDIKRQLPEKIKLSEIKDVIWNSVNG